MTYSLLLGGIEIEVRRKLIKSLHLRVRPPDGRVSLSAPFYVSNGTVRDFASSKLDWIRRTRERIRGRHADLETVREYSPGESLLVWGRLLHIAVTHKKGRPSVDSRQGVLFLTVRPGCDIAARRRLVESWCRRELESSAAQLVAKWEPVLGVRVEKIAFRRMKTRWGSCSIRTRSIRLNTNLIERPLEGLEYVLVHEMVHILEPSHGKKFKALMDRFLPEWRERRMQLCHGLSTGGPDRTAFEPDLSVLS